VRCNGYKGRYRCGGRPTNGTVTSAASGQCGGAECVVWGSPFSVRGPGLCVVCGVYRSYVSCSPSYVCVVCVCVSYVYPDLSNYLLSIIIRIYLSQCPATVSVCLCVSMSTIRCRPACLFSASCYIIYIYNIILLSLHLCICICICIESKKEKNRF